MRFSDSSDVQQAGTAALTAVCALNRLNSTAALRELVHRLLQHEPKVSCAAGLPSTTLSWTWLGHAASGCWLTWLLLGGGLVLLVDLVASRGWPRSAG
jgi:hypothetical protein